MDEKKKEGYEFGLIAEELASQEYLRKEYAVKERRWRTGKTEIDLILQKENIIVLAEVKARKSKEEDALESVTADKRRRMIKAADVYLKKLNGDYEYRFDIVTCIGDIQNYRIEIFEDAFLAADIF